MLSPVFEAAVASQLYVPDTNVLITRWDTRAVAAEVTDFMPHPDIVGGLGHCLVRSVRALRGRVRFRARCRPRLDYGRCVPRAAPIAAGVCFHDDGETLAGSSDLDAALLMMPLVRFVSATDPTWLSTLNAIGEQLVDGALVFRYRNADGLTGGEGAFTPCTFWYIECLVRAGRLEDAHILMERALGFANALGLYAEEVSRLGSPLGNFPQALTHLAFISAAYALDRRLSKPRADLWQP